MIHVPAAVERNSKSAAFAMVELGSIGLASRRSFCKVASDLGFRADGIAGHPWTAAISRLATLLVLQRCTIAGEQRLVPAHLMPCSSILSQRYPVSSRNCTLGRQDAGCWTPRDPFRPDKLRNRIAIFI